MATKLPTIKLNDGTSMPMIGYGTGTAWFKRPGDTDIDRTLVDSIKTAIKLGYVHLDGAEVYNTEEELGLAIKESGVPRSSLYVTTKVMHKVTDIPKAIDESLRKLQLDYVDLYLIHAPFFAKSEAELQQKWADMEEVQRSGKAKSIGVSNCLVPEIETLLKTAKVVPAIDQVEHHGYLQHSDLLPLLKKNNIILQAYGPLSPNTKAAPGPLDPVLKKLAEKYGVGTNEILLRYEIDQGIVPITTSGKESRLKEYLRATSFSLTPAETQEISTVGKEKHFRGFWNDKYK